MADAKSKKTTTARDAAAHLTGAFAALESSSGPAEPDAAVAPRRPRRRASPVAPAGRKAPAAMPAEQDRPPAWDTRMSLTLSKEMKRELDLAKVDDGVDGTARIRAMITVWQDDERIRRRIDRLAKTLR